ncbi:CpsB/CapC family capsule biosynthesis tyrosine phosphatase [Cytophaga sp. FL35]|uniref:tyrosine-protein phosphatase n=1 Tax=Cytophaga sp. FL35 TaxID=1904456 RepID=UPI001653BB97|nr:CpsB/CapC family capsule biosynthesis tyrosine phosphatase [Cytophaga sp. FL35]MBC6998002.1 histidinol phosphatase [Cytophaga sp. FL35]
MFNFFSKKRFLVDSLKGIVDIHNHILPGIDDGAKTVEDSINLIKGMQEIGIRKFIATPHIMHNYYPNTPKTISAALNKLSEELTELKWEVESLEASAEHMIDDNFENLLDQNKVMSLAGNYLLVEMSYLQPPINFDEAIKKTAEKNYFTILAHPERYGFLHFKKRKYKEYKEQGMLYQMNLLSLSDYYGKEVQKMALELLEDNLIDFVGSDIHNLRQIEALKKITISQKTEEKIIPIVDRTIANFY